ncbi:MAG: GNAT family N-acetyltransferase [Roseibium sp.]
MPEKILMETDRLLVREWQDDDLDPFAEMCADPEVMRYFPAPLTREQTAILIDIAIRKQKEDGFCFVPVETKSNREFLGFVGLSIPAYAKPLPFDPCVEVGWRLKRPAWGNGYATEAAKAWLRFGFETVDLTEIVSFTTKGNRPSREVMKRLGMVRNAEDDFKHPMLDGGHPLEDHVLYRLKRVDWTDREND